MRAAKTEEALIGLASDLESIERAALQLATDFTPLSDMRASAEYRLLSAQNLLRRYFADLSGAQVNVLEVSA